MGTGDETFARALEHAIAAGRNRSVARCLPEARSGLTKVSEFHSIVSARFVAEWLEARGR